MDKYLSEAAMVRLVARDRGDAGCLYIGEACSRCGAASRPPVRSALGDSVRLQQDAVTASGAPRNALRGKLFLEGATQPEECDAHQEPGVVIVARSLAR